MAYYIHTETINEEIEMSIEYIDIENVPADNESEYLVVDKDTELAYAHATFETKSRAMEWMLKTGLAATCEIIKLK